MKIRCKKCRRLKDVSKFKDSVGRIRAKCDKCVVYKKKQITTVFLNGWAKEYKTLTEMYFPRLKNGQVDYNCPIQDWEFNEDARDEMKRRAFMEI